LTEQGEKMRVRNEITKSRNGSCHILIHLEKSICFREGPYVRKTPKSENRLFA